MNERDHPVRQLLDDAAHGRMPTKAELDALPITGSNRALLREAIESAARQAVELKKIGHNGDARAVAREIASVVIGHLPEWEPPAREELPTDPRELAQRVGRHGVPLTPRPPLR